MNMGMTHESADRIVDVALALAGEHGWAKLSMHQIATKAGLPMSELYAIAPTRHAILCRLADKINRTVLATAKPDGEGTAREKLFEVLMSRLDALQAYKPGLRAIKRDLLQDPGAAALLGLLMAPSMAWMLEAAGIGLTGWDAPIKVLGLTHLYSRLLHTWMSDDSEDLGKTMAELDRLLKKAEGWAGSLNDAKAR